MDMDMDFFDAKPSSSGRKHVNAAFVEENSTGSPLIRTQLNSNGEAYQMKGQTRGRVLLFNQTSVGHQGTNVDVERLYNTLPQLGFQREDILQFEDFRYKEMERVAVELRIDKDLVNSDCLMVIILTYGGKGDMLLANDGYYHLNEFMEQFTLTALPSMAGKPKLFIIAACRENKPDEEEQSPTISRGDDFMVVKSSHYGSLSFCNEQGSCFIQEFCNVIEKSDLEASSIFDFLTDTNNATSNQNNSFGKIDTRVWSTLTRRLYFKRS